MAEWQLVHVDDVPEIENGQCLLRPVRQHLGITAFGLTAWTARNAGDRIVNEHDEDEPDAHEEVYLVLRGRATFEVDGQRVDAPQGTFVFVPPKILRTAFAEEPGTTIVAVGAAPGRAYEPSGWELWSSLRPFYEAGDLETVVARGRELVEANPDVGGLLYNLACCESLTGRTEDALTHLRRAIGLSDVAREYARGDSDFDALRGDPAFVELVG